MDRKHAPIDEVSSIFLKTDDSDSEEDNCDSEDECYVEEKTESENSDYYEDSFINLPKRFYLFVFNFVKLRFYACCDRTLKRLIHCNFTK